MRILTRLHDQITKTGYAAASAALVSIVLLYCYEVAARYFLSRPTTWSSDVVGYLLCVSVFLAMPEVTRRNQHIAIDVLHNVLANRKSVRRVVSLLTFAVALAACLFVAGVSFGENLRQFDHDITTMSALAVPQWWISSFITYGFLSSALYFMRFMFSAPIHTEVA